MKGHGTKYPRKKEQAIVALLSQSSMADAAQVAGVSETTLWRWLQEEEFCQSYREAKRRVVDQAVSRLQQLTGQAVNTLGRVMASPLGRASTQVTAARVVLDMALKAVEMEDLAVRIERLEHLVEREKDTLSK